MHVVSEHVIRTLATLDLAFDAVRDAFIAVYAERGKVFPVVIAHGQRAQDIYSIKSGTAIDAPISGLKIGTYWPNNHAKGIPNHNTTTILLDNETGHTKAILGAGYLNCLRTAAADAVAVSVLARPEARTLALMGAGHQAVFEARAACAVRPIERIMIWSRSANRARAAAHALADAASDVAIADARTACSEADVIVTVTPATAPLMETDWVKPGTHISAMGADTAGKQELPVELVRAAKLFADLPPQSKMIGEFRAAAAEDDGLAIRSIGGVLTGEIAGREDETQITIFDSSGIALQDIFIADRILSCVLDHGQAVTVDL